MIGLHLAISEATNFLCFSGGVPFGAYRPCQIVTLKFFRPSSCSVGRSFSAGVVRRLFVVTAKALTFLASMCVDVLVVWSHIRSIWPPIRSVIAGPVPLYGTACISTFSAFWNSRPHRREADPMPALPRLILPLLARIHLTSAG